MPNTSQYDEMIEMSDLELEAVTAAGGAGNDTVQVNGSNTDGDVILVSPNGSRSRDEHVAAVCYGVSVLA